MEYTPLGIGAAVGVGAGLLDRSDHSPNDHLHLLYRAGGLGGALYAQHKQLLPRNVAPSLVTAFAALLATRGVTKLLEHDLGTFGAVVRDPHAGHRHVAGCTSCGQR